MHRPVPKLLSALVGSAVFAHSPWAPGDSPKSPGPFSAQKRLSPAQVVSLNRGCVRCHQDIAHEWQASLHAQAYTNPEFQRALDIEPLPFCKGCHAPDADPDARDNPTLQGLGVNCVSCHVTEQGILGAQSNTPTAAHPVVRSAAFSTFQACAGCHQFAFPGESERTPSNLMQSTVTEFLQVTDASFGCATCHMPVTAAGHRSHRFDVTRNPNFLSAALRASARRRHERLIEIQLSARRVGHAFPTGDLFRRLAVEVQAVGPEYALVESHTLYLTREFEATHTLGGVKHRRPVRDTRLTGDGTSRTLAVTWRSDISQYPIKWRVLYQRVQHPGKVGQPDAEIAGEIELAAGELAVEDVKP